MSKQSPRKFDVLVIGGGPAGMAAAVRASESGAHVGLVDDNFRLGGQIWRSGADATVPEEAANWLQRVRASSVEVLCPMRVFDQPEPGRLVAESADEICELAYESLVIATGARERFLAFPGWTLPNVMGAGGLQAMVKSGLTVKGKRVVVAGTGPLLLAVAAYLRKHGAEVLLICEQASWASLARFGLSLGAHPGKIQQALGLKRDLAGIPLATGSWVIEAQGDDCLRSVTISRRVKSETFVCDFLACGYHLVPNTELAALLGCRLADGFVQVDDFQQTCVTGVFCAGEPTGVGGVELALVEGQIAGLSAAGQTDKARTLFPERKKLKKFAAALDRTFGLRSELRELPTDQTIVCRCEDVTYGRLRAQANWRTAKLQTRCGMGPCQGRICGPATQFLFGWKPDSVRPPVFPARVESLAAVASDIEPEHQEAIGGHR
jgi:NADPH-dependent 2,4-dienoyl-CoA reductase/sulfur reductase-like enzyme